MWRVIVLSLLCAVLATPAAAQLRGQIQKLDDQFSEAFNRGDAEAVAEYYTDDAVALPPGSEMVRGKKAILEFWKKTVAQLTDLKAQVIEVKRVGRTHVREIGGFTFKTKSNPPQEVAGKYVVLWQKVAGRWKLNTDIWNTNQ